MHIYYRPDEAGCSAFHRLQRLKGSIWALTLYEAYKYYELADFAKPKTVEYTEDLYLIRKHLTRRINKLSIETGKLRWDLIEKYKKYPNKDESRTDLYNMLACLTDREIPREIPKSEMTFQASSRKSIMEESYSNLYKNIGYLASTDYTQSGTVTESGSQYTPSEPDITARLSPRRKIFLKCASGIGTLLEKMLEFKNISKK